MAARFLVTGEAKTQADASRLAGLHPNYLGMLINSGNPRLLEYIEKLEERLDDGAVDMAKVLTMLGRRAVRNLAIMAEMSESEAIRFKANQDLADRSPETSKTQKIAMASLSLESEDVKHLAASMVEAANVRRLFAEEVQGNYTPGDTDGQSTEAGTAKASESPSSSQKVEAA